MDKYELLKEMERMAKWTMEQAPSVEETIVVLNRCKSLTIDHYMTIMRYERANGYDRAVRDMRNILRLEKEAKKTEAV